MRTILIVDGDIGIRNIIRLLFTESMGFRVIGTTRGADAVVKAKKIKPDIVITNIYLSDKSGYQVSREIKNSLKSTPVLLLAPVFATFDKTKVAEAYADDFIAKPFEYEEIIRKVESLTTVKKNRLTFCKKPKTKPILIKVAVVVFATLTLTLGILYKVFGPNTSSVESKTITFNDRKDANRNKSYFIKDDLLHPDPDKLDYEEFSLKAGIRATRADSTKGSEEVKEGEVINLTDVNPDATVLENEKRKKEESEPNQLSKTPIVKVAMKKENKYKRKIRALRSGKTQVREKLEKTYLERKILQENININQEKGMQIQTKLIAKYLEQSSMDSIRFKLWNSDRSILGPVVGNAAANGFQQKESATQKKASNNSSDIRITDWSFHVATTGVAIIHNVTIENKSRTSYERIKVRLRYYSHDGIEVSRVTGILPVVVPPYTKRTYLKEGAVIGAGSGDMYTKNIEVLAATPIHDN